MTVMRPCLTPPPIWIWTMVRERWHSSRRMDIPLSPTAPKWFADSWKTFPTVSLETYGTMWFDAVKAWHTLEEATGFEPQVHTSIFNRPVEDQEEGKDQEEGDREDMNKGDDREECKDKEKEQAISYQRVYFGMEGRMCRCQGGMLE
ncbi:hypothetical protein IMY05_C4911000200 [Salix suchowensis]|nr:hypothetical protein IMY05_C4911000200 [Salix suchowensis]